MKTRGKLFVSIGILAAGILILGTLGLVVGRASGLGAKPPEAVVRDFYTEYLDSFGRGDGEMRNPLAERAYRDNPSLHADFIKAVDNLLTSFEASEMGSGYDPFLLAQDVPTRVTVTEAATFDSIAHVKVETSFEGHELLVTLTRARGKWRILAVNPLPEETVATFYEWYTTYPGNPIVDGAYVDHPLLTASLVGQIEKDLAAMKASETPGGVDPILLAQDIPAEVRTEDDGLSADEARVKVQFFWSGNPEPSEREVTVVFADRQWKIDGIGLTEE